MLPLLSQLLLWLDRSPVHFWSFVGLAAFLLVLSALAACFNPQSPRRWNRPLVFAALLALALFAFRWPLLFDNRELSNPDESHMVASALVLQSDPVFWRSVDGTTHGPLAQYPLALLGALGARLDYTTARLFALALAWSTLVFTWLALRVRFGDGLARVLTLPAAALQIVTPFWDFVQYSSEHVPAALLATATWLILAEAYPKIRHDRGWRWALAGVLLGAVPFAKLQGAPLGVWLGGYGLVVLLLDRSSSWSRRLRSAASLAGGALVGPLAMLTMVLAHGLWPDFWAAYIVNNLVYGQSFAGGWTDLFRSLATLVQSATGFTLFAYPMLALLLAALPWRLHRWPRAEGRFNLLALGLLLVAAWAVAIPGRNYTHYLHFTISPLALATGALVGGLIESLRDFPPKLPFRGTHLLAPALVLLFLGITLSPQFRFCTFMDYPPIGHYTQTRGQLIRSPEATLLAALTRPDEPIAIWGWMPRFLVEAQRQHGTRDAYTAFQIYESPVRDFYRRRYLADLHRAQPPWFLDTTGPGSFAFDDRERDGHETFPELATLIARDYRLAAESRSARLYQRIAARD